MKKSFKIWAIALIAAMVFPTFAAGKKDAKNTAEAPTQTTTAAAAAQSSTTIVTDELGRQVSIPQNPKRILCLTSALMEALYNIGLEPVGKVEEYNIREQGKTLPSVGKTSSVNMEAIMALTPDLIIASSRYHGSLAAQLEQSQAAVFFFDPDGVGQLPLVQLPSYVGKLVGKPEAGKNFEDATYALAKQLKAQLAGANIKSAMMIQEGDTISAVQRSSGYGTILTLLEIENIVPDNLPNAKKSPYVVLDAEKVIAANPSAILIIAGSRDKAANDAALQKFKGDAKWANLDAVKNGKVYILPFKINPNRATLEEMLKTTASILSGKSVQ